MPHAIYAHSSLSKDNTPNLSVLERIRGAKTDVALAMGVAGVGNLAVLVFSAANLFGKGELATLTGASGLLSAQLGSSIGLLFVVALFASGLASSAVGNFAASEIATGLLKRKIHPVVRWSLALGPALLLIAFTPNVTDAVILSQVVLSFGLPFAIFPLVKLTADSGVMGAFISPRSITVLGYTLAGLLTLLNLALVGSVFFLK
jgi:manganese transport protein